MKLVIKSSFALLASSLVFLLGSCVYTETMDERERERQGLQKELDFEIEKGKKLTR